jgi:hypothetical protein
MFKVFVTINCDDCRGDFFHGRVSSSNDSMDWNAEGCELIAEADQTGWDFFRGHMRCAECNCPESPV